jgi:hypothetical protein
LWDYPFNLIQIGLTYWFYWKHASTVRSRDKSNPGTYLLKGQAPAPSKPWAETILKYCSRYVRNLIHIQNVPSRNDPSQNDPSHNVSSRNDPVTKGPRSQTDPSLKVPSQNDPRHETTQITKRPTQNILVLWFCMDFLILSIINFMREFHTVPVA